MGSTWDNILIMKSKATVSVELNIGELMSLIEFNNKLADSIPESQYNDPTMAGTTFGDTARKCRKRAEELYYILNETWEK